MPGMLIEGKWTDEWKERNPNGQHSPKPTTFRNCVTMVGVLPLEWVDRYLAFMEPQALLATAQAL
jgi:hypothetical protein